MEVLEGRCLFLLHLLLIDDEEDAIHLETIPLYKK